MAEAMDIRIVKKKATNKANESANRGNEVQRVQPAPAAHVKRPATNPSPLMVNPATGEAIASRGKERTESKPHKPSKLKMAILEERQDSYSSSLELKSEEEVAQMESLVEQRGMVLERVAKKSAARQHKPVAVPKTERDVKIAGLKKLPKVSDSQPTGSGRSNSSRIFALLFHNLVTPQLNDLVYNMLQKLSVFHYRALALKQKKPSKAMRGKRFVAGFSQCLRSVVLKRCKLLLLVPNVEPGEGEGSLDEMTLRMAKFAHLTQTPFLFVLTRRKLAAAIGIHVRTSAVAILNPDGCNEEFEKIRTLFLPSHVALAAIRYKKEIQDVMELVRTCSEAETTPTDSQKVEGLHEEKLDATELRTMCNDQSFVKIDRMALVDSEKPGVVVEYLGGRAIDETTNVPCLDGDQSENGKDFTAKRFVSHTHTVDMSALSAKRKVKKLSLKCFTSVPFLGSVVWKIKQSQENGLADVSTIDSLHTNSTDALQQRQQRVETSPASTSITSHSSSNSASESAIPGDGREFALVSQHAPFILRARVGKFVRDWHPPTLPPMALSPAIHSYSITYDIEATLFSEFNGRGEALFRYQLKLSLIWPSTEPPLQPEEISAPTDIDPNLTLPNLENSAYEDGEMDTEDAAEEMKVLLKCIQDGKGDVGSEDESDSEDADVDEEHQADEKVIAASHGAPSFVTGIAAHERDIASIVIPTQEEVVAADEETRKERRRKKREVVERKKEESRLAELVQEMKNAENRSKHEERARERRLKLAMVKNSVSTQPTGLTYLLKDLLRNEKSLIEEQTHPLIEEGRSSEEKVLPSFAQPHSPDEPPYSPYFSMDLNGDTGAIMDLKTLLSQRGNPFNSSSASTSAPLSCITSSPTIPESWTLFLQLHPPNTPLPKQPVGEIRNLSASCFSPPSHHSPSLVSLPTFLISVSPASTLFELWQLAASVLQISPKNLSLFFCGVQLSPTCHLLSSSCPTPPVQSSPSPPDASFSAFLRKSTVSSISGLSSFSTLIAAPLRR